VAEEIKATSDIKKLESIVSNGSSLSDSA